MKLLNFSNLRVYLITPIIGSFQEGLFDEDRTYKISFDTGGAYLKADEYSGSNFRFYVLGFGVSFYYNFKGRGWE